MDNRNSMGQGPLGIVGNQIADQFAIKTALNQDAEMFNKMPKNT